MVEDYNWNIVFNFIMELKKEVLLKTGSISYDKKEVINKYGGKKELSCVENWARILNNKEYIKRLEPIQINQAQNLVLFRYANHTGVKNGETEISSFDNDFWDLYNGFYRECRSLVIDVVNDCVVIAPFKKFMNLNQSEEYSLENIQKRMKEAIYNHKPVEISTKLDGSMQCANYYQGKIVMNGAQAIDKEKSWRLSDGYARLQSNFNLVKMIMENSDLTFIFEYISLKDAHVVKYTLEQEGLYLIGIRENKTGKQWSYEEVLNIAKVYQVQLTTDLHKESLEEILNNLDKYKSSEAEGVVLNIDGFLVKIKYNDYIKCHKLLSAISSSNLIIEAYADGWIDDLIAKIPVEYRWRVEGLIHILENYKQAMEQHIEESYQQIYSISNGEITSFMTEVQKYPKEERKYIIQRYKNQEINLFKTQASSKTPHYKNLSELGLKEDYERMLQTNNSFLEKM